MLRAGGHTFAAGLTGPSVYPGDPVFNVDRVEGTGLDTVPKPQTAKGTAFVDQAVGDSHGAVLNTHIVCFFEGGVAVARAFDIGDHFSVFTCFHRIPDQDRC